MSLSRRQVLAAGVALPVVLTTPASAARPTRPARGLTWAGRTWNLRSGTGGPGPNTWDGSGPYVDSAGHLHLRIWERDGRWVCSEVFTSALGFGTYEWTFLRPASPVDPNVVLGLFTYETDTREIDVEIARWGGVDAHDAQWAVQPAGEPGNLHRFTLPPADLVTVRYTWTPGRVVFSGEAGDSRLPDWSNDRAPTSKRGKVHMNLWLFEGRAPTDGAPVDVALTDFRFTPAG